MGPNSTRLWFQRWRLAVFAPERINAPDANLKWLLVLLIRFQCWLQVGVVGEFDAHIDSWSGLLLLLMPIVAPYISLHQLFYFLLPLLLLDLFDSLILLSLDLFFFVMEELFEHAIDELLLGVIQCSLLFDLVLLGLGLHFLDASQVQLRLIKQVGLLARLLDHVDQFAIAVLAHAQLGRP